MVNQSLQGKLEIEKLIIPSSPRKYPPHVTSGTQVEAGDTQREYRSWARAFFRVHGCGTLGFLCEDCVGQCKPKKRGFWYNFVGHPRGRSWEAGETVCHKGCWEVISGAHTGW